MSVTATYVFEVDWNNDDDWADANEDITADVLDAEVNEWNLGRDYASQLTGRSTAGQIILTLENSSNKYNSFNTASAIYGNIVPGRKVRIRTTAPSATTLAIMRLDSIIPQPAVGGAHRAILRANGALAYINQRDVSVPMQTSILTGSAVTVVLDEIGWSATDRQLDVGQTTMNRWWTGGKVKALTALRDIEETEAGFIRETKDGKIAFEDRHHRFAAPHTVSQATYSDAAAPTIGYTGIAQADPLREIYNIIEAAVQLYTVGGLAVLWTLAEVGTASPLIPVGESKTFWASYPNPDSGTNAKAVDAWTTPVATTDYLANSQSDGLGTNLTASIGVAVSKFDTAMKITLTNNHATLGAYITFLQGRGTPITADDPVKIVVEDSTSQTKYGERTYPIPGKFIPNTGEALDYANFIKSIFKDPIPVLSVRINANRDSNHMAEVLARDVSDRVTIVAANNAGLGINEDFFVEAIHHRIESGKLHTMTVECSPASAYGGFFILGTSLLGISTRLGY